MSAIKTGTLRLDMPFVLAGLHTQFGNDINPITNIQIAKKYMYGYWKAFSTICLSTAITNQR